MSKGAIIALSIVGVIILLLVGAGGCTAGAYNSMVTEQQNVNQAWSQVENVYQRRMDLIPNLVEVVKGVANFEKETFTAVAEARASVGQVKLSPQMLNDPASFKKFQAAQDGLSSALSRLMMVTENYPQLKANENFTALQSQLEGTENRIAVERQKFNQAAQSYNTLILKFPKNILAGMFGFQPRPYFEAEKGADKAPKIKF